MGAPWQKVAAASPAPVALLLLLLLLLAVVHGRSVMATKHPGIVAAAANSWPRPRGWRRRLAGSPRHAWSEHVYVPALRRRLRVVVYPDERKRSLASLLIR